MNRQIIFPIVGTLFIGLTSVASASGDQRNDAYYQQHGNPFDQTQSQVHQGQPVNQYQAVHVARKEKRLHEEDYKQEKDQKVSRWKQISLSKYKDKMTHKWYKSKEMKRKREEMKLQFGAEYRYKYANKITACAVKLMEKHYAGTASFIEGASFLKELREKMAPVQNVRGDLEGLYRNCHDTLAIYKEDKKAKKIDRVKFFSADQKRLIESELHKIFPYETDLIELLKEAYSSDMECHNPKGGTFGMAFGLGGYGGFYRQKCRSPLGRRFKIYKLHAGLNYGIGGVASTSVAGSFTRHPKQAMQSTPNSVKFDHHGAAALGVGAGENVNVPMGRVKKMFQGEKSASKNSSKGSTHVSPAVGLGIYFGLAGLSGENKSEIKPDFDILFTELQLYHRGE